MCQIPHIHLHKFFHVILIILKSRCYYLYCADEKNGGSEKLSTLLKATLQVEI